MKHITIITATVGKNHELAQQFSAQLSDAQTTVEILNVVDLNLPLYASTLESQYIPMDLVGHKLGDVKKSDGFIFCVPEYNGGLPPAIPNFLAWVSRSTKDWREAFNGKPCAIGTYSAGGGSTALAVLRLQLSYLGLNVIGRQVVTNSSKPADESGVVAISAILKKLL